MNTRHSNTNFQSEVSSSGGSANQRIPPTQCGPNGLCLPTRNERKLLPTKCGPNGLSSGQTSFHETTVFVLMPKNAVLVRSEVTVSEVSSQFTKLALFCQLAVILQSSQSQYASKARSWRSMPTFYRQKTLSNSEVGSNAADSSRALR